MAQKAPTREITAIAGDLYRVRNNFHFSVFLVTPAGIIVTDPIDVEAARWLKEELARRFDKPIKYLIYSHDHTDHVTGGEVFADTAVVISHERAKQTIIEECRPTAVPQIVFSDRLTIELGGKQVELMYVGRNHSDNSIVMLFPEERVLFAVDFIAPERLPFQDFPDAYIEDWIDSLKRVETLDFDILAPGHDRLGRKEHVRILRGYIEELRGEVLKYVRQGKTVDEIKGLVKMENYKSWSRYKEWISLNVEGMYRHVQSHRRGNADFDHT